MIREAVHGVPEVSYGEKDLSKNRFWAWSERVRSNGCWERWW